MDLILNIINNNQIKSFDETHNVSFYDIRGLAKTIEKFYNKKILLLSLDIIIYQENNDYNYQKKYINC